MLRLLFSRLLEPLFVLASTGLPNIDGGFLLQFLGSIVLILIIINQAKAAFGKSKIPDPINIKTTQDDITRREFDHLEEDLDKLEKDLPEMERRILSAQKQTEETIVKEIKDVADRAYKGRQKIWDQVNENRENIGKNETAINLIKANQSS